MPDSSEPGNIDRYAVFGNPVEHSQSPLIHTLFAKQTSQSLTYTAELIEPGQFSTAVKDFASHHGKGLNITAVITALAAYFFY